MTPFAFNYPPELPVSEHHDEILEALAQSPVVIVCGDTGSGKTTQLPKMALEYLLGGLSPADGARGARALPGGQAPGSGGQSPGSGGQAPGSGGQAPGSGGQAPGSGGQAPGSGGQTPRLPRVACTQPRRLAAVTMAERVADELNVPVGGLVGYQHRYGHQLSKETEIKFMTDGVLLAETRTDPLLRAYDVIIVDEAHERSLNVDFLLGILKRILARRRDLSVIVSSATLDVEKFSTFFDHAPVISVPGRLFPIDVQYRPPREDDELDLPRDVANAVLELPPSDDILVFLPGERDIRETADHLARLRMNDDIIPLLASLPAAEQQRAFRSSPRRRIILATNVAETSVTIPGIRCVIDSGLARISRYIHRTQVQRLQIEPVSQASARQRAGRCGRLGPGTCIRLYSEDDFNTRDAYTPPEVLRSSLAGVILTMLDLRLGDIERFPFLDPPRPAMIHEGLRELLELGAIRHDAVHDVVLTDTGRKLAKIPVEPRLARMLLAASDNATLPAALPLVAAMSCDDPKRRPVDEREKATQAHAPFRVPGSDFLGTLKLWNWWEEQSHTLSQSKLRTLAKKTYLSYPKMREWRDLTRQLTDLCKRLDLSFQSTTNDDFSTRLHMALLSGLLGRIGKYDPEEHDYRGAHGLRFALHPSSILTKKPRPDEHQAPGAKHQAPISPHQAPGTKHQAPQWIMAGELVDTARLFARNAAVLDPAWIEPVAGNVCKRSCHSPEYDPQSGFVRATEQVTLYGLVIVPARRCDFSRYDPAFAREIFIRHALVDGEFPQPPPEVRANNALLDALRSRAEKTRHPEFFDADKLCAHFEQILPADITNANALRKWLRQHPEPRFVLKKSDWWPNDNVALRDFPETIRIGGATMSLSYRHTPDDPEEDGITCTVRKSQAAALRLWRADWLVPGALPEKLHWLLATLPSAQRRVLSPIEDTVAGLLLHLKPGSAPLVDAVRETVYEQWGIRIVPDAWDKAKLPTHLQVRYRIRDDSTGRTLAISRNLDEVLSLAGVTTTSIAAGLLAPSTKYQAPSTPSITWSFGKIPEKTTDAKAGWTLEHFPALHDDGTGVSLRLHANAATAAIEHAAAVTRLYLLTLGSSLRVPFRRKTLNVNAQLYLSSISYPDAQITDDIFAGAVREAFVRNQPAVRDGDEFARRLDTCRNALVEDQCEIGRIVGASYNAAAEIDSSRLTDGVPTETVESVRTQLAWLVYRGFPARVPLARLRHFARYLKGARLRLERARTNPAGDLAKEARFAPYWQVYEDAVTGKSKEKYDAKILAEYRWLVEEYRVSVFAQELRTAEPVSPKRLEEKLGAALLNA